VALGEQWRTVLRHHPWLPGLVLTRPVLGPNGLVMLEHVLTVLAPHPADLGTKLEAFAMLNGITAQFVQFELSGGSAAQQRTAAYLQHAVASGEHPRLARLLSQGAPSPEAPATAGAYDPADRYGDIIRRILTGLLGAAPAA
jgi:hypothetical protein